MNTIHAPIALLALFIAGCEPAPSAAPADPPPPIPSLTVAAPSASAAVVPSATASSTANSDAAGAMPDAAIATLDAAMPVDSGADAASSGECPAEMAQVVRFCIDRWEAHLTTRDASGTETIHPHFDRPAQGVQYLAASTAGLSPQGYISRVESAAACKNAGKRLCSMNEWQRTCQGKRAWNFPYGNSRRPGKCNHGKIHLLSKMYGTNGRAWKYDEHFNSPLLDQEPGFLAKGGEYAECVTDSGVFDLIGNLHEWVSDSVTEDFVDRISNDGVTRRRQPWHEGNGIFMGGFFSTGSEHGPGCKFTTFAHEPTYHDYSIGFRCCTSLPKSK